MKKKIVIMLFLICNPFLIANAQNSEAFIINSLNGRSGNCSEDARDTESFAGVQTSCSGNTFNADVSLSGASVKISGNVATVNVKYAGKYTRDLWGAPCVKTGSETKNLSGNYSFTITQVNFVKPAINPVGLSNVGEVSDLGHDSTDMLTVLYRMRLIQPFETLRLGISYSVWKGRILWTLLAFPEKIA